MKQNVNNFAMNSIYNNRKELVSKISFFNKVDSSDFMNTVYSCSKFLGKSDYSA